MTQAEVLTDTLQGVAGAVTTGNFQERRMVLHRHGRVCNHLFFVVVCL